MRYIRCGVWLCWFVALTSPVMGHQVGGDSYLHLKIDAASIQAQWGIALFSFGNVFALDGNKDGKIAPDEAQAHLGMMAEYALARLKLSTADGTCPLQPGDHEVAGRHAIIRFTPRCPLPLAALTIDYNLFFDVDTLHRGLLRLEHQGRTHTGIFTSSRAFQHIQLVDFRPWHQFMEYIIEGIWHIWLGFDHLLFLIVLLVPAVLQRRGRNWEAITDFPTALMRVLTIVTSFTVAHSLTLGVAVLGAAAPPPRVVESIIAASVVVAALNNLFPLIPAKRMVTLTFAFGLIHGFGFANVLQELGLPRGALVLSLVGFNLGVEMGQLAIVGVVFPWAYALRQLWVYRHVLLEFGSAATAGIALLWFVERAFDLSPLLPTAPGVDLRAELARLAPFVLAHLVHPLIIIGGALVVILVVMRTLLHIGRRTGHTLRWQGLASRRLMRSGLWMAFALLVLGIVAAFNAARQDANLMAKAAEIAGRLAMPLREQLRIADPEDRGHQEQLATVREAITFLVEQHRKGDASGQLSEVLDQLAAGQTAMAQAYLKEHTEVAMTRGDGAAAAVAQRYQGTLALVEDMSTALKTYRRAVELDPQGWHGWTSLAYLLGRAQQYPEAESAARRTLELAQAANDSARLGMAYENLGIVLQARGAGEEAEGMYREALNTYRVLGDEPGMARVYSYVGSLYGARRRFDKAQAMYRDALSIHQRLRDQVGMANDYANLGAIYAARGLSQQGEAMYLEALGLNEALDRKPGLALNYADLARLSQRGGDSSQAELRFRQALAIDEDLNYRPGIASHASHLGMLYRQAGDLEQATAMLHRALGIDLALGHHLGLAINSAHLASIYQMRGDLAQAEALYQQALATNELLGREVGKAANYAHLGHIYRQRGELEQAGEMYRRSLALFAESGVTAGTRQVQVWLDALQSPSQPR